MIDHHEVDMYGLEPDIFTDLRDIILYLTITINNY